EPDRRYVRVRGSLRYGSRARASAARARRFRSCAPAHAARARGRPLPLPRPPRTSGGGAGRCGRARAAASVLDHTRSGLTLSSSTPPIPPATLLAIVLVAGCSSTPAWANSASQPSHARALAPTQASGKGGRVPSGPPLLEGNGAPSGGGEASDG